MAEKKGDFRVAICAFVETPGLSSLMPRLVTGLGSELATEYYCLSIECAREAMAAAAKTDAKSVPFWAIAESKAAGHTLWEGFGSFHSGEIPEDGLRFAHVHAQAKKSGYQGAIFIIGGRTPQLSGAELAEVAQNLRAYEKKKKMVVGLCHDGGAYLLGFPTSLDPETWKKVPYGEDNMAEGLLLAIEEQGHEIIALKGKSAIEAPGDFKLVQADLEAMARSPAQDKLLEWLKQRG